MCRPLRRALNLTVRLRQRRPSWPRLHPLESGRSRTNLPLVPNRALRLGLANLRWQWRYPAATRQSGASPTRPNPTFAPTIRFHDDALQILLSVERTARSKGSIDLAANGYRNDEVGSQGVGAIVRRRPVSFPASNLHDATVSDRGRRSIGRSITPSYAGAYADEFRSLHFRRHDAIADDPLEFRPALVILRHGFVVAILQRQQLALRFNEPQEIQAA